MNKNMNAIRVQKFHSYRDCFVWTCRKKKRKKLVTAKTQEHISVVTLVKNISDALLPLRHFQCAKSEQTDAADMVTAWLRSLLLAKCSSSQSVPCAVCI